VTWGKKPRQARFIALDRACRDPCPYSGNIGSCASAIAAAARGERSGELDEPQVEGPVLSMDFAFHYNKSAKVDQKPTQTHKSRSQESDRQSFSARNPMNST